MSRVKINSPEKPLISSYFLNFASGMIAEAYYYMRTYQPHWFGANFDIFHIV